jgi:hypothetical protein
MIELRVGPRVGSPGAAGRSFLARSHRVDRAAAVRRVGRLGAPHRARLAGLGGHRQALRRRERNEPHDRARRTERDEQARVRRPVLSLHRPRPFRRRPIPRQRELPLRPDRLPARGARARARTSRGDPARPCRPQPVRRRRGHLGDRQMAASRAVPGVVRAPLRGVSRRVLRRVARPLRAAGLFTDRARPARVRR